MTIKKNIINHMEFLGYEIEKMEADNYFFATHNTHIPIMIKLKEGFPVSFETLYNLTKKDPEKNIKYFTMINEINKKSYVSTSIGYEKQLMLFALYMGDYNKKYFSTFIEHFRHDTRIVYDYDTEKFLE